MCSSRGYIIFCVANLFKNINWLEQKKSHTYWKNVNILGLHLSTHSLSPFILLIICLSSPTHGLSEHILHHQISCLWSSKTPGILPFHMRYKYSVLNALFYLNIRLYKLKNVPKNRFKNQTSTLFIIPMHLYYKYCWYYYHYQVLSLSLKQTGFDFT